MIKHFIDIEQFTKRQLDLFIRDAKSIKKNPNKFLNYFDNNITIGLLFLKQSTRTKLSFNVGIQKNGGKCNRFRP